MSDDPLDHLPRFHSRLGGYGGRGEDYMQRMVRTSLSHPGELAKWCGPVDARRYDLPDWLKSPPGKEPYLIGSNLVPMFYEIADEELLAELEAGEFVANGCLVLFFSDAEAASVHIATYIHKVLHAELVATRAEEITPKARIAGELIIAHDHRRLYLEGGPMKDLNDKARLYQCVLDRISGHQNTEQMFDAMGEFFSELMSEEPDGSVDAPAKEHKYSGLPAQVDALIEEIRSQVT